MFTVILLSDRAKAQVKRWQVLFEPFVEDGKVVFCDWNHGPSARTLAQAVPGLAEAVRGKKSWRVLVVGSGTNGVGGSQASDPENPFDYLANAPGTNDDDRRVEELSLRESVHALVRLSHMLLGYPHLGVREFTADPSYWDTEMHKRVHESEAIPENLADEQARDRRAEFRSRLSHRHDVLMQYREVHYSDEEREEHALLSEQYRVRQERPAEVIFLATREPRPHDQTTPLRRAWMRDDTDGPSRFVERNDYPDSCRFAVYDLPSQEHPGFELREFGFWLTALTVATNDLPPSSFQAERLYQVDVEFDRLELARVLNEHLGNLVAIRDALSAMTRQVSRREDKEMSELLQVRTVPVEFEQHGGENLRVSASNIGLAADAPGMEHSLWMEEVAGLEVEATGFVRSPKRVLAKSVRVARRLGTDDRRHRRGLSDFDKVDLQEELATRTSRLTRPATADILSRVRLAAIVERNDKAVRNELQQRMKMTTVQLALGFVLAVWLVALAPYLIQAWTHGASAFLESLVVVVMILGLVVGVAVGLLLVMRARLVSLIRGFNSELQAFVASVKGGAAAFGDYLSDLATYMHGQGVLAASERRDEAEARGRRRMQIRLDRVRSTIEREKSIIAQIDAPQIIESNQAVLLGLDLEYGPDIESVFRLESGQGRAELNSTGATVAAPYEFVSRIVIEGLPIREKAHS